MRAKLESDRGRLADEEASQTDQKALLTASLAVCPSPLAVAVDTCLNTHTLMTPLFCLKGLSQVSSSVWLLPSDTYKLGVGNEGELPFHLGYYYVRAGVRENKFSSWKKWEKRDRVIFSSLVVSLCKAK